MNCGGYKLPQSMPTTLYPEKYLGREIRALSRLKLMVELMGFEPTTF